MHRRTPAIILLAILVICAASLVPAPAADGRNSSAGHTSVGSTQWFVAEGSTGGGFDTYIIIVNPNDWRADVEVIFSNEKGPVNTEELTLQPLTRKTLKVSDYAGSQWHVSTVVRSSSPVVVERSMYWDKKVKASPYEMKSGHSNLGVSLEELQARLLMPLFFQKNKEYLSEGTTAGGFDTWVLIVNPNNEYVSAKVEFIGSGGVIAERSVTLPSLARKTVHLENYMSNSAEIATRITSDLPLIAERSTYWDKDASRLQPHQMEGGSATTSAILPSTTWYFAEASSRTGFKTYILVQNPQDKKANITLTFYDTTGQKTEAVKTVNANSRSTFLVSDYVSNKDVAVKLSSDVAVTAERSTYWDTSKVDNLWQTLEGNSSTGSTATHKTWVIAEGSTAGGFHELFAIANFGDSAASVTAQFMKDTGVSKTATFSVPARTRYTLSLDDYVTGESSVSVLLDSSSSALSVDRSMYWDKRHVQSTAEMQGGNSASGFGSDQ
ncbi:MAG: DUF5719 family protein [Candidatus Geothermincolia bacterium]